MPQQKPSENAPRVGVAVIIKQNRKIILGRRKNHPMRDSWQLPGGWIRLGETPEQSVQRQLDGFQGLKFSDMQFAGYTNNIFDSNTHTFSLYFMVNCLNEEPQELSNSDKNEKWFWVDWYDLPQPLFLPLQLLKQSGFLPFNGGE